MGDWNPRHYLKFSDERTRPSRDLVAHIAIDSPASVIDLGCGPGNSTQVLVDRWPEARVVGLDSSLKMIETARREFPSQEWVLGGIEDFSAEASFDVVFSNAALQWVPDHAALVERLFRMVSPGGAFAFQIPSADDALVRTLIHDIARSGDWAHRMSGPLDALSMQLPSFYYDQLAPRASRIDMWETEYLHVLDSPDAIVDWIASTGLRPFLDALDEEDARRRFEGQLRRRVSHAYSRQVDGKVLFPFKRTFVIAYA